MEIEMAKRIIPRSKGRKRWAADQKPTVAERNRAIRKLRPLGGAHLARPANSLVEDTPAHTIHRCKGVIECFARLLLPDPFSDPGVTIDGLPFPRRPWGESNEPVADVLFLVAAALEHAENVLRSVGSMADAEVVHG